MRNAARVVVSITALCLVVTGCSTPQPVLDLASQGVVVTGQAESELESFVSRSQQIYAMRLEGVKRLAIGDNEANAVTEYENFTAQRAGMSDQADLMKLIKELSDYRAKVRLEAIKKQADLEKSLGAAGDPVKVPKDKLADIKRAFAVLAQELSDKEWLKFAFDYGKQVKDTVKTSKDEADESAKSAEAAKPKSK